jgi:hypothetical protein
VVEKILAYPWEPAPAHMTKAGQAQAVQQQQRPQAAAAPGGNGAAVAGAAGSDTEDKAVGVLLSVLAEAGGQIKKTNIAGKAFASEGMKAEAAPVRNAILGLIVNQTFLAAEGRPWTYDPATGTVSLG